MTRRLESLPVRLAEASDADLAAHGASATYNNRTKTMTIPSRFLNATGLRNKKALADMVRHEGMHRIQDAEGRSNVPSRRLATAGATAALQAVKRGDAPAAAWRDAVDAASMIDEGEAYLVDYHVARALGDEIATRPVLNQLPALERQLGRPLAARDVAMVVRTVDGYAATAAHGRVRARATTELALGAAGVGIAATGLAATAAVNRGRQER